MSDKKLAGWASSSVAPEKLSTTISGAIITFSAIIIGVASHYGLEIGSEDVSLVANQIGLAVGSLTFLYGLVRKFIVKIASK